MSSATNFCQYCGSAPVQTQGVCAECFSRWQSGKKFLNGSIACLKCSRGSSTPLCASCLSELNSASPAESMRPCPVCKTNQIPAEALVCDQCKLKPRRPDYRLKADLVLPPTPECFELRLMVECCERVHTAGAGGAISSKTVYSENFLFPRNAKGMIAVEKMQRAFFEQVFFVNAAEGDFRRQPTLPLISTHQGSNKPPSDSEIDALVNALDNIIPKQ